MSSSVAGPSKSSDTPSNPPPPSQTGSSGAGSLRGATPAATTSSVPKRVPAGKSKLNAASTPFSWNHPPHSHSHSQPPAPAAPPPHTFSRQFVSGDESGGMSNGYSALHAGNGSNGQQYHHQSWHHHQHSESSSTSSPPPSSSSHHPQNHWTHAHPNGYYTQQHVYYPYHNNNNNINNGVLQHQQSSSTGPGAAGLLPPFDPVAAAAIGAGGYARTPVHFLPSSSSNSSQSSTQTPIYHQHQHQQPPIPFPYPGSSSRSLSPSPLFRGTLLPPQAAYHHIPTNPQDHYPQNQKPRHSSSSTTTRKPKLPHPDTPALSYGPRAHPPPGTKFFEFVPSLPLLGGLHTTRDVTHTTDRDAETATEEEGQEGLPGVKETSRDEATEGKDAPPPSSVEEQPLAQPPASEPLTTERALTEEKVGEEEGTKEVEAAISPSITATQPSTPTAPEPKPLHTPSSSISHLLPLPLPLPSTPARDLSAVSTTATAASSIHSSPILTPLSPTTTTTTLDSVSATASVEVDSVTPAPVASSSTPPSPAPAAAAAPPPVKLSWAEMIRKKNAAPLPSASSAPASTSSPPPTNGAPATPSASAPASPSSKEKEGSLTRSPASSVPLSTPTPTPALSYSSAASKSQQPQTLVQLLQGVESDFNAPPVVPRGLINNGNLCFINSILQVLVYTTPFWNLVGRLRKGTKADLSGRWVTLDAMMRFLEEFRPAPRIEVVSRSRTKSAPGTSFPSEDTFIPPSPSSYSEPFIPEEVYDSLKPNKRFDAMRRGHQEDAEEFLGFFLETLHDEVLGVMDREEKRSKKVVEESEGEKKEEGKDKVDGEGADGWLEVGSKGRTATTRTTETRQSPITKIFGGQLRSVLRCPGQKDSITLEPYQRLQLDISPPNVRTVEEALQNLTTPEALPDFVNRAGIRVEATKQVYLESYPPVLILHLKRFLYDNVGGVQKSGKVIGYGTELTIDEKIVAPNKRTGKPIRYQLYGVVYHHGKSASGGHYTVAVRQQINSNSWVHIDDTSIRPISPGDVAVDRSAGGSMENRGGSDGYGEKNAYLLCYRLVT